MLKKLIVLLIMVGMSCGTAPLAFAQGPTTGSIKGQVYDIAGSGPIPGAKVTATNNDTGLPRSTVTDANGNFTIGLLAPGTYTVVADCDGFEQREGVSSTGQFIVRLSKDNELAKTLIGLVKKGATTTAPAPTPTPTTNAGEEGGAGLVDLTGATRGGNIDRRQLDGLPLSGIRTFDAFAFLFPGVALPPQPIGTSAGPGVGAGVGTSGQFSVNGLRSRSNNFTVDGSDNNDEDIGVRRQGFTSLVAQPIESVQDFRISTALPEPQYGRNLGAQVNAVSRGGSRNFHGGAQGFFTDQRLIARSPFDLTGGPATFPILSSVVTGVPVRVDGTPLAPRNPVGSENPFTRVQAGAFLGGPLGPRGFFFGAFEVQRINASQESNFAVPTVAQRGLFGSGDSGLVANGVTPVFPTSVTGDAVFSLFPFPNNPRGPYGTNTFTQILPASADGVVFSIKAARTFELFNREHTLTGRYNFSQDNTTLPVTGEALFSSLRPRVGTQNLSLFLDTQLSSRFSNQVRGSFGRTRLEFREVRNPFLIPSAAFPNTPFLLNAPSVLNVTLPGVNPITPSANPGYVTSGTVEDQLGPIGQLIVSGFSPVGVDVFNFPQSRVNNTFQIADTASYGIGAHRLTFGVDIRRAQLNSNQPRNSRPRVEFNGAPALGGILSGFIPGTDFASAGAASNFLQTIAPNPDATIGLRYTQYNFFVSDQFKVRPNLTINYGLRYERNGVPREVNNRIERSFGSTDLATLIAQNPGLGAFLTGRRDIYEIDNNNVAPYFGIAWDPFKDGKTAIRGGYGLYYDQVPGAVVSQSRNVFPNFITLNLSSLDSGNGFELFNPIRTGFVSNNTVIPIVRPGTLNTFNQGALAQYQSPLALLNALAPFFPAGGAGFVLPQRTLKTPYSQQWSLGIERELARDFFISAAYVGTRGTSLLRQTTPNLGVNGIPVVTGITAPNNQPIISGTVNSPRLPGATARPIPGIGSFTLIQSDASSMYHSLQLQANKRFSKGLQFTTAYTWSHAIDDASDLFALAGNDTLPQNSFDRRSERGSSSFDTRHRFVFSAIYELPFFQKNRFLGGFQVAAIGAFSTGQPYTITAPFDVNLDGNLSDRINSTTGLVFVENGRTRIQPPTDIRALLGAPGSNGSIGRNTFRGQGIATVDFSINKKFEFFENQRLDLRVEFFNLFNRANYGLPVRQVGTPGFGSSTDIRTSMRTIQFAVKYNF